MNCYILFYVLCIIPDTYFHIIIVSKSVTSYINIFILTPTI